jgi:protease II
VRLERKDGLPRIVVRDRATGEEHTIAFDEEAYSLGLSAPTNTTPTRSASPIRR